MLLLSGGRSGGLDARANRWDAEEHEKLKQERENLKADIDVSGSATWQECAPSAWGCWCLLLVPANCSAFSRGVWMMLRCAAG